MHTVTTVIDGKEIGEEIRTSLETCVDTLRQRDVEPGLATVLMSDDPASETYVAMKQRACEKIGIRGIDFELSPEAPAKKLLHTIDDLNDREDVHGILVQLPLPDHVEKRSVLERVHPEKDVDAFHPENVGRLVAGHPRFKPATPHGIQRLLAATDIETDGSDVAIVGRSDIVGKPLANLLLQKKEEGNATVTVCHSRTRDLAAKTRQADILIAAAGVPELIDGSMVEDGVAVIDVGVNRVPADNEKGYELVGDVDFDSVAPKASAITPVPGGVGPMTITMLLYNTVKAASRQTGVAVELP